MREKIKIRRWLTSNNYYLEIEDSNDNTLASFKVIHEGKISNMDFLEKIMDGVDKVFQLVGLESPFSKLYQAADDQRMSAIKDVIFLLGYLDPILSKVDTTTGVCGEVNELLEIKKRWNKESGTMLFNSQTTVPLFI